MNTTPRTELARPTQMPAERKRVSAFLETVRQENPDDPGIARCLAGTKAAELYWVTRDMAQLALDGSHDIPAFSLHEVLPCEIGWLIYEPGSMPTVRHRGLRGPGPLGAGTAMPETEFRGFSWSWVGDQVHLWAWSAMLAQTRELAEAAGLSASPTVTVYKTMASVPMGPVDCDEITDPLQRGLVALLGSTLTMMQTPTVAEPRVWTESLSRQQAKRRAPASVTTVGLRRLARKPATEDPETARRVYTHQWVVRGHWRQQAVGERREERRPTWVAPYIKGPEGAPLLASEKVHTWRR